MLIREVSLNEKDTYNNYVQHIVQSWAWGETKEKMGKETHRYGVFSDFGEISGAYQVSLHPLPAPLASWHIGYLPKGPMPNKEMIDALIQFGEKKNIIFFKLEPFVGADLSQPDQMAQLEQTKQYLATLHPQLIPSSSLFTPYNFVIDLTKSDEEIRANMHPKTRYNINIAQKKGVTVKVHTDEQAFETFLNRYFETCKRNGFFGHDKNYHRTVWETLRQYDMARVLIGYYNDIPLTTWMLFNFHNTLYYPYGGSTIEHREVMASNLVAYEAINLGRQLGCTSFDMWGALGPDADASDPFYGFHRFKSGYGPQHLAYAGTYDVVVDQANYQRFLKLEKYRKKALDLYASFRQKFTFLT